MRRYVSSQPKFHRSAFTLTFFWAIVLVIVPSLIPPQEAEQLDRVQSQGPTHEHVIARDLSPGYYTIIASGEATTDKQCAFELNVYATDDITLDLAGSRLLPRMPVTAPVPVPIPPKTSTSAPANNSASLFPPTFFRRWS